MLNLGLICDILGKEFSSPEGKEEILKFLTSPKGTALLQELFESPDAKPLAGELLMPILGSLEVPDTVKQSMRQYIPK